MVRLKYPDRDLHICGGGLILCFTKIKRHGVPLSIFLRTNAEVVTGVLSVLYKLPPPWADLCLGTLSNTELYIFITGGISQHELVSTVRHNDYSEISDIILFDSKGYEQSLGWDHNFLNDLPDNINKMVAGNIQFDDDIDKYKKICNYIDISGGIESSGVKDISKIDIFLNKVKKVNDEN